MGWTPRPGRIFRWPRLSAGQIRREVDAELAHHLELAAEDLERRGMSPEAAREEARRRFGNLAGARRAMIREDRRLERQGRWRGFGRSLREDLTYAVRSFRERPGFAAVTLATLAVGIATATIFFGAVDGILLQPVALDEPERVVELWGTEAAMGVHRDGLAPGTVEDLRERSRTFAALAAAKPHSHDLLGPSGPIAVNSWIVSEDFFRVLRTKPAAGRLLGPADFDAGGEPVVVISHAFWMSQYGGSPEAAGRPLALDGAPHVVVGVVPADFPVRSRDLFIPREPGDEHWQSRFASYFSAYGRLRPGVSLDAARAELAELEGQLARDYPEANEGRGFAMAGLRSSLVEGVSDGLWLLFAAATLILVVSCVNAAGLMLAQAATRTRELAIRAAVGAGQGRLMRQLLTEASLLALLAAVIAVPVAAAGLGAFRAYSPPGMPRIEELSPDYRIAAFAVLAAFVVAMFVGLVPAVRVTRPDLYEILKPGGRSGTLTPTSARLRSVLVGIEVAIAVVLLIGGGLLLRSWGRVLGTEQGYRPDGIAAVEAHYWQFHEHDAGRAEFGRIVRERLVADAAVESAAVASSLPLAPQIGNEDAEISLAGDPAPLAARFVAVSPGYFETLGVPVIAGRPLAAGDAAGAEPVAIVSVEAARRLWPGGDPVGEMMRVDEDGEVTERRVVGVVADVRYAGLEATPDPTVYVPHAQSGTGSVYFVVRTAGGSGTARGGSGIAVLRSVLADLQPSLVVAGEVILADEAAAARQPRRFSLMLLSAFGLTALLLTVVGLFGHLGHSVRTREHELGVRMALGAWPGRLIRMVLGQGVLLVLAGAATGLILAFGLSRFMSAMLYEVAPSDPVTFLAAALVVLAAGTAASYLPARRVSRVDPAVALRIE